MTSLVEQGEVVGSFMGRDIHASLSYDDGSKYEFVRAGVTDKRGGFDMSQLGDGECVVAPGLIYRRAA